MSTQKKTLKSLLAENKFAQLSEILLLFSIAFIVVYLFQKEASPDTLVYNQAVIWFANIVMLSFVWVGLRVRGLTVASLGLSFGQISTKAAIKFFALSVLVFALATLGFVIGSIIMANITGIPEGSADLSNYAYLKDNIGMLLLTLSGVYIVASFGEEVIYRAFLINRLQGMGLTGKLGTHFAVILSAIIFGFAHYSWGAIGIVQTGFMGLALSYSYLKMKKRLWVNVVAHGYMDTILMVQLY